MGTGTQAQFWTDFSPASSCEEPHCPKQIFEGSQKPWALGLTFHNVLFPGCTARPPSLASSVDCATSTRTLLFWRSRVSTQRTKQNTTWANAVLTFTRLASKYFLFIANCLFCMYADFLNWFFFSISYFYQLLYHYIFSIPIHSVSPYSQ